MSPIRPILLAVAVCLGALAPAAARAGEADDLQRMIDTQRQAASFLEGLDETKAVREDITLMRVWLDTAWRLRSETKYDDVRVVLDRVTAQAEMVREKITAAKLLAQAAKKDTELQVVREQNAKLKEQIQAATIKKAQLEGRGKS